jgi:hypothetical protein
MVAHVHAINATLYQKLPYCINGKWWGAEDRGEPACGMVPSRGAAARVQQLDPGEAAEQRAGDQ